MTLRTRIDGVEVYLDGDQLPGVTKELSGLVDPGSIRGTRSTTIRALNTKELQRVLGSEAMNELPALERPQFVIDDGGDPLFTSGVRVIRHDRDLAELVALADNAAWFDWAKATRCEDISLPYTGDVDQAYQEASWSDEDGLVHFMLADFGSFKGEADTFDVAVEKVMPILRVHRFLHYAFDSIGYKVRAKGRLLNTWKKYVFGNVKAPTSRDGIGSLDTAIVRVATGGVQSVDTTPFLQEPGYLNTTQVWNPGGHYNASAIAEEERYLVPFNAIIRVQINDLIIDNVPSALNGTPLYAVLYEKTNGLYLGVLTTGNLSSGGPITFDGQFDDVFCEEGWEIVVAWCNATGGTETVEMSDANSRIRYIPITRPYTAGSPLVPSSVAPRMTVMEAIVGLCAAQGLMVTTDEYNKVVTFHLDDDFFKRPGEVASLDWSGRADHSRAPAKVVEAPEGFRVTWEEDRNDLLVNSINSYYGGDGYGNGYVEVGGIGKAEEVSIPFSPTAMGYIFGRCRVPIMRGLGVDAGEDEYDRGDRMLIADGVASGTWTHDGVSMTEYPVTYFFGTDSKSPSLAFDNLRTAIYETPTPTRDTLYKRRIARLRSRILEIDLFLEDWEVKNLDFSRPVIVDDGHGPAPYYVLEVKNHRFGMRQPTQVRLIEIDRPQYVRPYTYDAPMLSLGDFNEDFNNDFLIS